MVMITARLRSCYFKVDWDILMVKCLALMKVSNLDYLFVFLGTILGEVYGIAFGLDVGIELGSLYGSFDGSNDVKFDSLVLEYSLGYTDGRVLDSD